MEQSTQQITFDRFMEPAFSFKDYQTTIFLQQDKRIPENIGRFRLFQTLGCSFEKDSIYDCLESETLLEVVGTNCTDDKLTNLEDYMIPRYTERIFRDYIEPALVCYDSSEL